MRIGFQIDQILWALSEFMQSKQQGGGVMD